MKHKTTSANAIALGFILMLFATPALAAWQTPETPTTQLAAAAADAATPAPGITTTLREPYFKITSGDVEKAIAEQLQLQAVVPKAEVRLAPGTSPIFHQADHSLKIVVQALQIDAEAKRWQAQIHVVANGQTETVKPASGFYDRLVDVPMLSRQLNQTDIIEATDITTGSIPERTLRKDTVTTASTMIGRAPRSMISPNRAIRTTEITSPVVIKKGEPVELSYTTRYMNIKTKGIALEDGAKGSLIRVKNEKSEKAVSGRVEASGRVEVNTDTSL